MLTVTVTMEVDIGYKRSGNRGAQVGDELGCNCGDAMMRWFGGTDVIVQIEVDRDVVMWRHRCADFDEMDNGIKDGRDLYNNQRCEDLQMAGGNQNKKQIDGCQK